MQPGEVVGGRFEIAAVHAQGGMGRILRARDLVTGRTAAVKCLLAPSADAARRFVREAELLEEIRHPHVVGHLAHGETASGPWLAMEWLEGEDLDARIARGPLSIADALAIGEAIASALGAMHARGIVHRDVKPGNVLCEHGEPRRARLLDLGLARAETDVALTVAGAILGTPRYMAPEQARGERELDARADVFALGAVLFECLSGRPAFAGTGILEVLANVLLEPPPALEDLRADVPPELAALVGRMLEKDRSARPASGQAVAEALRRPDAAQSPRRVAPTTGLGIDEQRSQSIVLVGAADATGRTIAQEEAGEVLSVIRAVADRYGARCEPLVEGSALLVVAGVGTASDDAARAARLALEIHDRAPGHPIALVTGRGQRSARVPTGDLARRAGKLASEMRSVAERGVRIDEVTAGLVRAKFRLEESGEAHRLIGAEEDVRAEAHVLGRAVPCVGRDREIAALLGVLDETMEDETARVALVTAPPGTGKSRLARELLRRLEGRDDVLALVARGDSMTAGSALAMLAATVRHAAGAADADGPVGIGARVRERARASLPPSAPEIDLLVALAGGEPTSEVVERLRPEPIRLGDAMRLSWEAWIRAETASRHVAIVLDDLHWGDRASVAAIERALRPSGKLPLFVLALARPNVHEVFPDLFAGRGLHEIRLSGLSARAGRDLARRLLGDGTTESAVKWVVERGEGNPFHIEELARAVAGGASLERVPDSVLAMIEGRLDVLGPILKRTLRAAAIFGERFHERAPSALLPDLAAAEVGGALGELRDRELLTDAGEGTGELRFHHPLIREVAYATLTDDDRRRGHAAAARWLEREDAGTPLVVAEHHARAGDDAAAAPFFFAAAEAALAGDDYSAVLACAQRGEAGADPLVRARLRLTEACALRCQGRPAEAADRALVSVELAPVGGSLFFRALGEAMAGRGRSGREKDLAELVDRAIAVAPSDPEAVEEKIVALARAVIPLILLGQSSRSSEAFQTASDLAAGRAVGPIAVAQLAEAEAELRSAGENLGAVLLAYERAIDGWSRAGVPRELAICQATYAGFEAMLYRLDLAEPRARAALATADALGIDRARLWARLVLGAVLAQRERLDEALELLAGVADGYAKQGVPWFETGALRLEGLVLLRAGRLHDAILQFRRGLGCCPTGSSAYALRQRIAMPMVLALLETGARDQAEALFREYAATPHDLPVWRHYAESVMMVAALAGLGRIDEARALAALSLALRERMESTVAAVDMPTAPLRPSSRWLELAANGVFGRVPPDALGL